MPSLPFFCCLLEEVDFWKISSWSLCQAWLPATGHAERVRKICGFARKSAEHYFGQRKYGEHTIALIEGSAIKDLSGSNVGKNPSEPGGTRRRRVRHVVRPSVQHTPLDPTKNFRGKHILFLFWPSVTSHYLVEETPPDAQLCHTHTHTYIHTFMHSYSHTLIHSYIHTYVRMYIQTYIRTYVPTYIYIYI